MEMLVETYETSESGVTQDPLAPDTVELINELGLKGQQRYVGTSEDGETERALPFRLMTQEEQRVYETLFPVKSKIDDYSAGLIPQRVLGVISEALKLVDRDALSIWHPKTFEYDPVLVAKVKSGPYSYEYYILARWGEALEDFGVLLQRAKEKLGQEFRLKARKVVEQARGLLEVEDAEDAALEYISHGGSKPTYY